jgi:2-polyprenyl-3-methyl-5-hydroxy-6-metoxy-1,4-benzoquinol methylase
MANEVLDSIKKQFNSIKRVDEMLVSYGLTEKEGVARDVFEHLREKMVVRGIEQIRKDDFKKDQTRLLDVGCGIGNLVIDSLRKGIDARGVDCAEEMVRISKERLASQGYSTDNVQLVDFLTESAVVPYDLITAIGVIWYYENKNEFLKQVHSQLVVGGVACVVHRNGLFHLSAFNQGTLDFFRDEILAALPISQRQDILQELVGQLPSLEEQVIKKTSAALAKGYDNPLTIAELYNPLGFEVQKIYYTYIHHAPPRLKMETSDEMLEHLQRTYESDWRGMFLGSQFMVVAKKVS